jgi:hypothetical protein
MSKKTKKKTNDLLARAEDYLPRRGPSPLSVVLIAILSGAVGAVVGFIAGYATGERSMEFRPRRLLEEATDRLTGTDQFEREIGEEDQEVPPKP